MTYGAQNALHPMQLQLYLQLATKPRAAEIWMASRLADQQVAHVRIPKGSNQSRLSVRRIWGVPCTSMQPLPSSSQALL